MSENDLINQIIFKKYKSIKIIGKGSFGSVYLGKNIIDKTNVAIKFESKNQKREYLENEAYLLYLLKGIGIPKVITFGKNKKYNILIEQLLGKSLNQILFENGLKLEMKDCCMIGLQLLDRLEFIHSKYIIHRDIKPENFLIGIEDESLIYIIDFGLSKKYMSSRTGKHVNYRVSKIWSGTPNFASINTTKGIEPSRRDDLESLFYVLLYLMKGSLPWQNITKNDDVEEDLIVYRMKKYTKPEIICEGLPKETIEFFKYCKNLKFEEEPNYKYLRSLLYNILNYMNEKNDLSFSWLKNDKKEREFNRIKKHTQKRSESYQNGIVNANVEKNIMEEINIHNILVQNETQENDDLNKNPSSKDFLKNTLYNIYKKKNNKDIKSISKSKSPSRSKSKSKISISFSELISFGEKKTFGKLNRDPIFKNELKNKNQNIKDSNNNINNNQRINNSNIVDINKCKEKLTNNINKINNKNKQKKLNDTIIAPKLLNSTDFWGDNFTPKNNDQNLYSFSKNIFLSKERINYINLKEEEGSLFAQSVRENNQFLIKKEDSNRSPINFNKCNLPFQRPNLFYK